MDDYNPQLEEQKTNAANENINPPTFEQPGVSAIPHSYVTFIPYGFTPKTYEERKGIRKSFCTTIYNANNGAIEISVAAIRFASFTTLPVAPVEPLSNNASFAGCTFNADVHRPVYCNI
mgnify:CR=1 FL=1